MLENLLAPDRRCGGEKRRCAGLNLRRFSVSIFAAFSPLRLLRRRLHPRPPSACDRADLCEGDDARERRRPKSSQIEAKLPRRAQNAAAHLVDCPTDEQQHCDAEQHDVC